tara:strand:- start:331 stop:552 length:222 start_codon:yes stop_codon:yes gene_type:complete
VAVAQGSTLRDENVSECRGRSDCACGDTHPAQPEKAAQKPKEYYQDSRKQFKFSRLGRKAFEEVWGMIGDIFD